MVSRFLTDVLSTAVARIADAPLGRRLCFWESANEASVVALPRRAELRPMQWYGHRGGSDAAPENTAASISWAFQHGAHGVEFDLQLTRDGKVIVLHDDTLERTADLAANADVAPEVLRTNVSELLLNEVRAVDIGAHAGAQWRGERVMTFSDALALVPQGCGVLAELKGGDHAIVEPAVSAARGAGLLASQIRFISFDLELLRSVKAAAPEFRCWWISTALPPWPRVARQMAGRAAQAGMDGIDYLATNTGVTQSVVDDAHRQGLEVGVWVVSRMPVTDSPRMWAAMERAGVDVFTSNLPPAALQWAHLQP